MLFLSYLGETDGREGKFCRHMRNMFNLVIFSFNPIQDGIQGENLAFPGFL